MNALEMKLIAMKFALTRRAYVPNDPKSTSNSRAYDVGTIQEQLSQGVVIDDRDLTITNTIVEECDHAANTESPASPVNMDPPVVAQVEQIEKIEQVEQPPVEIIPPTPSEEISNTIPEPVPQPPTEAQTLGFGGRIWQYFKDTGNGQPKS